MNYKSPLSDQDLSQLLRCWHMDTPLPPRFQEDVWRKIEQQSMPPLGLWGRYREQFACLAATVLRQPAGATAYLLILLLIGAGMGYWSSVRFVDQKEAAWRSAYLLAVNPYPASPQQ
jgi:hypothetical protein